MKTSEKGLSLIKRFEGCHLTAYRCPAGVWTIGYGHTNEVSAGDTITQSQADEYLTKDSVRFHHHLGYQMVGEFHQCGYKFGRWYNMVWMEKFIGAHVDDQPEIKTFDEIRGVIGH